MNRTSILPIVLLIVAASTARCADGGYAYEDEYLQREGVGTDAAGLLAWLRGQTATAENQQRVQELIARLGSDSFEDRESATRDLIATGPFAVPLLQDAANHTDAEIARRIRVCLDGLNAGNRPFLNTAAVRALLRLRPAETTKTLLAFLPDAHDDMLEEEIIYGLYEVAQRAGKIEPVLVDACADPQPLRRATAACIVGRLGTAEQRDRIAALLRDTDAEVRLRAAQGLLAGGDKRGLPTLAALVESPALPIAWQAEELLRYVAGETSPDVIVGMGEGKDQRDCRRAWQRWLRRHEAAIDAERLAKGARRPGLFMAYSSQATVDDDQHKGLYFSSPQLALYGCDGRERWQPAERSFLSDLAYQRNGRVLSLNHAGLAICESDVRGRQLGVVPLNSGGAGFCQQLPGGRLLVGGAQNICVFGANGAMLFDHQFGATADLRTALAVGDCRVACILQNRRLVEIDLVSHKVVREDQVEGIGLKGNVIVCGRSGSHFVFRDMEQVMVCDPRGKTVRVVKMNNVSEFRRLSSGNSLLHFSDDSRRVAEMDGDDKVRVEVFLDKKIERLWPVFELLRLGFDQPCEVDVSSLAYRTQGLHNSLPRVRRGSAVMLDTLGSAALPALADIGALLNDENDIVRRQARDVLKRIGPEAIRVAIPALRAGRPATRISAAQVVGHYGSLAGIAVPELLANLRHEDGKVREQAAQTLLEINPDRAVAEEAVIAASADAELLGTLSDLLERWAEDSPKSMDLLLAGTRSTSFVTRLSVARSLGKIRRHDERILPALIGLLADPEDFVRNYAASAIGVRGAEAKGNVEPLLALVNQYDLENTQVRGGIASQFVISALRSATDINPRAAKPCILSLMLTPEVPNDIRSACCKMLPSCEVNKEDAEMFVNTIFEDMGLTDDSCCFFLVHAGPQVYPTLRAQYLKRKEKTGVGDLDTLLTNLRTSRAAAKSLLPELIATIPLKFSTFATTDNLIILLGGLGPDAVAALPGILQLHANHECGYAPWALARIAPKDKKVLAVLQETIRNRKAPSNIRAAAAVALNETGNAGRDLLVAVLDDLIAPDNAAVSQQSDYDSLLYVLKAEHWHGPDAYFNTAQDPRVAVIMSLGVLGADAAPATAKLQKLAEAAATPPAVRLASVWTLGRIGADAAPDAPALCGILRNVSLPYAIRIEASRSLAALGTGAVPSLVEVLPDKDWAARLLALKSLETLSAKGKLTLPAVEAIASGHDPLLARAAQAVCGQTASARK